MLWSLVLLTALGTGLVSSGRSDVQLASNLRLAAAAEMAADAAVYQAAYHLIDPTDPWPTNGSRIATSWRDTRLTVCIVNEDGKVNPNTAAPALMAALLVAVGATPAEAQNLAIAIYNWRMPDRSPAVQAQYQQEGLSVAPSGSPFMSVGELASVIGMRPDLLARLSPYLTVLGTGEIDPRAASPLVLQALRSLISSLSSASGGPRAPRIVTVTALAETRPGGRFIRRAALQLKPDGAAALTWETGETAGACR